MRIEDYAVIGNRETMALVGRDGSIDWLCLPRFDSPACFAALLGTPEIGCWRIAPADPAARVTRRYRPGTLVLETRFETASGVVTLTDAMHRRQGAADSPLRHSAPSIGQVPRPRRGMAMNWVMGWFLRWPRPSRFCRRAPASAGGPLPPRPAAR